MRSASVTIKDIAKMLGISKSTVSRALTEHSDVNPETRRAVLDIAQRLNYQPNSLALAFKQQRTNTLGVIIPETVNRFFAEAVGGIQHVANSNGFNVMICQSNESFFTEKNNLKSLVNARVDGVMISVSRETDSIEHFRTLIDKSLPIVFFDRIMEDLPTSQVFTDNYEIAFKGTEHLIQQGRCRIAIIAGPQNLYNSRNRLKGYRDALAKYNMAADERYVVHSHFRSNTVEDYTRYLINVHERPDAVFAINDYAAVEMMHVFKKNGLSIPQDIAVLGFNNDHIGKFTEPTLSTIDVSAYDIGAAAAEILLHHIKDPDYPLQKRVIRSQLIIRGSTAVGL